MGRNHGEKATAHPKPLQIPPVKHSDLPDSLANLNMAQSTSRVTLSHLPPGRVAAGTEWQGERKCPL